MEGVTPGNLFAAALLTYLAGAALPFLMPGGRRGRAGYVAAFAASALSLAAALPALAGHRVELALPGPVPLLGSFHLALDPTGAFFALLIAGLAVPAALYGLAESSPPWQVAGFNLFVLGMLAVVAAAGVLPFLMAWELMALASYFLVMAEHQRPEVRRAGYVYLVMTHLGTLFIIAAFLLLVRAGGGTGFDQLRAGAAALPAAQRSLVFLLALAGFGTKGGLIPLHVWLPRAHPVAPSHASALMSGVMVKTAIYGLLRFALDFLGGGPAWWGGTLLLAGAVSALGGVLYAAVEGHLKRMLAFSTVENVGVMAMGLGAALWAQAAGRPAVAALAVAAVLYHAAHHSATKGLLFLGAGAVHHATGALNLEQMGGLIRRMPRTAAWFLAGAVAISALPPMGGLVSEWLLLHTFLQMAAALPASLAGAVALAGAAVLALTGALVAATMVKAYGVAFLGLPRSAAAESAREAAPAVRGAMAMLAVADLALGLGAGVVAPALGRVAAGLVGVPATGLSARAMLGVVAGGAAGGGLAPAALLPVAPLAALLGLAALGWLAARRYGRLRWRFGPTWTCGILPDPRMQYSAAGYTSPIRLMFRRLLWPSKQVRVTAGDHPLFPHAMEYTGGVLPVYDTHLYRPVLNAVLGAARRLRRLQMGDTQIYLIYLFGTLLLLLVLAR